MTNTESLQKMTNVLPAALISNEDAGHGLENLDQDTLAIPFLKILQSGSDEVKEMKAAYIEGAKAGMFFNTVTGELFDGKKGVLFLPCAFERKYLRFAPRGEGGFKGELPPEIVTDYLNSGKAHRDDEGKIWFEGDNLFDSRNHFGLVSGDGEEWTSVLLNLRSTQIKKSRKLLSILSNIRVDNGSGQRVCPPSWVNMIRLTSAAESNDSGDWYGINVAHEGFIQSADVYAQAKDLHKSIKANEVKTDFSAMENQPQQSNEFD